MDYSAFKVLKGIAFGVYTPEEIKKLSVLEITNTEILDSLGHPTTGGLHDLRLGPNERDDSCETCGLNFYQCPGHSGHITFPVPVYNPVFFPRLYQLLRGSCLHCHKLLAPTCQLYLALYQLQALDYGLVSTVKELAEVISDTNDSSITNYDDVSVIQTKLKNKFEEAIEGLNISDMKQPVRSVVECKREILKNFTSKFMMRVSGKCPHCKRDRKKIMRYNMRLVYVDNKRVSIGSARSSDHKGDEGVDSLTSELAKKEITPEEARKHLHALWKNDKIFLQYLFKILYQEDKKGEHSIDMFFMDVMMIPPSKFRRLNVLKGRKYADGQTTILNEILKDCHLIRSFSKFVRQTLTDESEKDAITKLPGKNNGEKYSFLYQQLQRHVNELFDSDTNKSRTKTSKGIKQILEKKEGLFRMNMMGKRVNYAARSVISPDPYINVNEIGIPMVFAKKLTYPEPVNQWNYEKLRLAVKNGPNIHPGATLVEYENGRIVRLTDNDPTSRLAIANTLLTPQASSDVKKNPAKIVHRHLRDGDMLLLNRQPTLHKPSIMAHKAKVLPGEKTLRLHYANCKSYNADFDGDEMNAHLPQSYLGQSECRHIVNVNNQYLVPKDGTALSGLIQDHIIGGVLLTVRGNFFKKDAYRHLILSALPILPKPLKLLPPAIIKPEPLWSGKQVVSTVIINLIPDGKEPPTVEGKAKVSSKKWLNAPPRPWIAGGSPLKDDCMSEAEVVIRGGELLCGIIDKGQVGPTSYSLIHVCYELYGGETSSMLLTCLARLFTFYLQTYKGFSLGIEDIVVTRKADKQRKKILKKAAEKGMLAAAKSLEVETLSKENIEKKYKDAHYNRNDFGLKMLDMGMKEATQELNNDVKDACMPNGLIKKFPSNNLQLMIESGAKGTTVNAMQISCILGQIELEGRRMPLMLNGSTLPSFEPYDTAPAAGGFVSGRFLTGISQEEYFFHCMAGREGLIDTAVKTSRSGYLQRCMIKHLEGITVNYDLTVRDSDGTVIQFLYGEDGLDVLKTQMLKENSLHLLAENYSSAVNEDHVKAFKSNVDVDLPKLKKQVKRWQRKHPGPRNREPLIQELPGSKKYNIKKRLQLLSNMKNDVDERIIKQFKKSNKACPDPVNSRHRPDLVFGSVSEQMDDIISNYIDKNLKTTSYNFYRRENSKKHKDKHKEMLKEKLENILEEKEKKLEDMFYYRAFTSLAEPGETVGLLAAQSIGEPSTQMTLNTFHFAGKGEMNVTLGIPRLREILMTASPNIATPTMDLPLLDKPGVEEKAEKLRLKLNPVSLKAVLEKIKVKEKLSIHRTSMMHNFHMYILRLEFLKFSEYKGSLYTSPAKILYYVEHLFVKKLIEAIKRRKRQTSNSKLIDTHKESFGGFNRMSKMDDTMGDSAPVPDDPKFDEGDSSGAESDGDGDATSAKSKMRHDQELEYEDPEEEEMIPEESEDENEGGEVEVKEEVQSDEDRSEQFSLPQNVRKSKKVITDEDKAFRINAVKSIHQYVHNYDFDTSNERWCEITLQLPLDNIKIDMKTLLEEEVAKALVYSVPNIKEALLVKNPNSYQSGCKMMLKTNGVNFLEAFKHVDILDVNKAYSNNIHAIAEIYGIEAAAKAVKKEIMNVFKSYNIVVDPRHLSLISDYMTSSGYYRPCNRIGMEGSASPLQQMTFETTKNFLVDAMLLGVEERLKGPSANIIVGQLYRAGTGGFDLISKVLQKF